ncbi:VWA domain-containing protein [Chryseobacterium shandongense]|uniref:VWA domain-containing protein n=1 Tax=Chryseobacterium shandongense TaxID=1493872 RepID=A0AAD1DNB2_9FLAO|nr:VWA domain-containing protein [Chryseobacterium shandongense]AZA88623.1 VWA domain-containing protein [Chryseobacterium shandongense]AZA97166.1 VWA domain-containing protein [Chryseobacterium shandongense]
MKNLSVLNKSTLIYLFSLTFIFNISKAQYGVSSGSVSHTVSNGLSSANESGFLNKNTIIVEDFMNYHKHQIKIPKKNEVALSIDYDNTVLRSDDRFLLQIGLATQNVSDRQHSNKVNISLVIDNSGSMGGGKLEKVKTALKVFVKGLKPEDIISIVKFDDTANLVLKSSKIKEVAGNLDSIIESIYPAGSTNIHSGMMMGYSEAQKHNTKDYNSKVILLTDGMTNSGITDPETILKQSKEFNDKGIDISTIGVGKQLDFDLLRKIATYGRGSNYFIGDDEKDIQKTFKDELESLLYNIGKKPKLTINLPEGMKIHKFYGYQPKYISNHQIEVELENLDCGQTQIFLMEVEKNDLESSLISASLAYEKNYKIKNISSKKGYDAMTETTQQELKKNFQIAKMATELKKAAKDFLQTNMENSKRSLQNIINYYQSFCDKSDEDLRRIYDIAIKYSSGQNANSYY